MRVKDRVESQIVMREGIEEGHDPMSAVWSLVWASCGAISGRPATTFITRP